jgi:hypothetical protein
MMVSCLIKINPCKDEVTAGKKGYTIMNNSYMIHTFSSAPRLLCLRDLKKEGVNPVIFLN